MDELFRFAVARPPRLVGRGAVISFPTSLTLLRRNLFAALDSDEPRARMFGHAEAFLASEAFVEDPAALEFVEPLLELGRIVAALPTLAIVEVTDAIEALFGMSLTQLREHPNFLGLRELAFDSLLALWIRPRAHPSLISRYAEIIRLIDLVERVAAGDPSLMDTSPAAALERTIVLPPRLFPIPNPRATTPAAPPIPAPASVDPAWHTRGVHRAMEALLSMPPADLEIVGGAPRIRAEALGRLPTDVRTLLTEAGVDLRAPLSIPSAFARLEEGRAVARLEAAAAAEAVRGPAPARTIALGSTVLPAVSAVEDFTAPEGPSVPPGRGPVKPPIWMPLMRVLQQIKRYEGGAIAHVENVMQAERRSRQTRRLVRSEETFIAELERTTEQERDAQTTERDELQSEVGRTIAEREAFKFGASISAAYGPVQISTNTSFESTTAVEEARRTATTLAREVAERTAYRVRERTREQRSRTTIEEFEERYEHGFDNTEGEAHINGIYRWLDKVYELEVHRYDDRPVFDIEVPEPAALFIRAMAAQAPTAPGLTEPEAFVTRADELTPENYTLFASRYRATGIDAPPAPLITVSETLESRAAPAGADDEAPVAPPAVATNVDIPTGYRAVSAFVSTAGTTRTEPFPLPVDPPFDLGVPSIVVRIGQAEAGSLLGDYVVLSGEGGPTPQNIPVLASASAHFLSVVAGVTIFCMRNPEALEAWQLRTYEAIMQAYVRMETDYQNAMAALVAAQGVQIIGRNPLENEMIMRFELQRAAITMITGQHFDHFSAILEGPGLPRIDVDEAQAEGEYVAFFSQAFEWENMAYVFRPYFWGRKSQWIERLRDTQDPDPMFVAFLRAGYARIQVPVRPNFYGAVLAFLDTGEVPEGDPAGIASPQHVGIVEEIKASVGITGPSELIDSFEIRLPTTLHILQQSDDLPVWERQEDGSWVPQPMIDGEGEE